MRFFFLTGRAPKGLEEGEDWREWKGGILKCGVCGLVAVVYRSRGFVGERAG
jgi:hypothetical protein